MNSSDGTEGKITKILFFKKTSDCQKILNLLIFKNITVPHLQKVVKNLEYKLEKTR